MAWYDRSDSVFDRQVSEDSGIYTDIKYDRHDSRGGHSQSQSVTSQRYSTGYNNDDFTSPYRHSVTNGRSQRPSVASQRSSAGENKYSDNTSKPMPPYRNSRTSERSERPSVTSQRYSTNYQTGEFEDNITPRNSVTNGRTNSQNAVSPNTNINSYFEGSTNEYDGRPQRSSNSSQQRYSVGDYKESNENGRYSRQISSNTASRGPSIAEDNNSDVNELENIRIDEIRLKSLKKESYRQSNGNGKSHIDRNSSSRKRNEVEDELPVQNKDTEPYESVTDTLYGNSEGKSRQKYSNKDSNNTKYVNEKRKSANDDTYNANKRKQSSKKNITNNSNSTETDEKIKAHGSKHRRHSNDSKQSANKHRHTSNASLETEAHSNSNNSSLDRTTRPNSSSITKPTKYGKHNGNSQDKSYTHDDVFKKQFDYKSNGPSGTLELTRKRKRCVIASVCVLVLVVIGGLVAVFMSTSEKQNEAISKDQLFYMLNAHVRMRITNRKFSTRMKDDTSPEYNNVSFQLCQEMDFLFLKSDISKSYYGCNMKTMRPGSIQVYYVSPFIDTPSSSNITHLKEILTTSSRRSDQRPDSNLHPSSDRTNIGDFLVETSSIEIIIERFTASELPDRPKLPSTDGRPSIDLTTKSTLTSDVPRIQAQPSVTLKSQSGTSSQLATPIHVHGVTQIPNIDASSYDGLTQAFQGPNSLKATQTPLPPGDIVIEGVDKEYEMTTKVVPPETTTPPVILVSSDSVELMEDNAVIQARVTQSELVHELVIKHNNDHDGQSKVLLTLRRPDFIYHEQTIIPLNPTASIYVIYNESTLLVGLNFTHAQCNDTGEYEFLFVTPTGKQFKQSGRLFGRERPGKPRMNLPRMLVENRTPATPITCSAYVGFPLGKIQWQIKAKRSNNFIPIFEDNFSSSNATCGNTYVTSSLYYTPTKEGNRTLLRCVVINDAFSHLDNPSDVAELRILPDNLCNGVADNKRVGYPFSCSKYIRCHHGNYDVMECRDELCFDDISGRCGQISLSMTNATANYNERVTSFKCRLVHAGNWSSITVSKMTSNGEKHRLVTFIKDSNVKKKMDTGMKNVVTLTSKKYEVELHVWIYSLTCADEGKYTCDVIAPFYVETATNYVKLNVKPEVPNIVIPSAIIEDVPMTHNITCEANVGYPFGTLVMKMKYKHETEFVTINNVTSLEESLNCSKTVQLSYNFIPSLDHNGVEIRCEVNSPTLPTGYPLVAKRTVHVIPGNFCMTHDFSKPHVHPYDCHQYVQCPQGNKYPYVQKCGSSLCFNPITLQCDVNVEKTEHIFDPQHPCRPNKNGDYFHHPFLCNNYIWCIQGQERVLSCPMGTLYLGRGICTQEIMKSRCYDDNIQ